MTSLVLFKLLLAHVVGFMLPGWLLARRLQPSLALWLAYPFSRLILAALVIACELLGLPITFNSILLGEGVVLVGLLLWTWRAPRIEPPAAPPLSAVAEPNLQRKQWIAISIPAALVAVVLLIRLWLAPLLGADTAFRWVLLGEQMLRHQTLQFYPPLTAEDFRIYFHPDGIPPLIASGFWWVFAAAGSIRYELSTPMLLMEWLSAIGLVYHAALAFAGPVAARLTAIITAITLSLFTIVAAGQESGLQVVSFVGLVAMLCRRDQTATPRAAIAAGLLAAIGILCREYGWAWLIVGALILALQRSGWRPVVLFILSAVVLGGPWYLRNYLRTGNPFYSLSVGPWLGVNPVLNELMDSYRSRLAIHRQSTGEVLRGFLDMLLMTPLQLLIGVPMLLVLRRRLWPLLISLIAIVSLWLASVAYTAGGLRYSLRVLSPLEVLLAIPVGIFAARLLRTSAGRATVVVILLALGSFNLMVNAGYPYLNLNPAHAAEILFASPPRGQNARLLQTIRQFLPGGSRILTDNAYIHAALVDTAWDVVPIWSPEVRYLFDRTVDEAECRRRLLASNIEYVLISRSSENMPLMETYPLFMPEVPGRWQVVYVEGEDLVLLRLLPPIRLPAGLR